MIDNNFNTFVAQIYNHCLCDNEQKISYNSIKGFVEQIVSDVGFMRCEMTIHETFDIKSLDDLASKLSSKITSNQETRTVSSLTFNHKDTMEVHNFINKLITSKLKNEYRHELEGIINDYKPIIRRFKKYKNYPINFDDTGNYGKYFYVLQNDSGNINLAGKIKLLSNSVIKTKVHIHVTFFLINLQEFEARLFSHGIIK